MFTPPYFSKKIGFWDYTAATAIYIKAKGLEGTTAGEQSELKAFWNQMIADKGIENSWIPVWKVA